MMASDAFHIARVACIACIATIVANSALAASPQSTPQGPGAAPSNAPPTSAPPRTKSPPSADAPAATPEQIPWPILMGLRSANIAAHIPVLDRAVLVPDEATFLDEISRWSPLGHWPVLIEDSRFAPRFIRAFKPKEVLRRTDRVAPLPDDLTARQTLIQQTLVRVWGADPAQVTLPQIYKAINLDPTGLVVTNMSDPAWTAALALAAGHGQLIAFIGGGWGIPSDVLDAAAFSRLSEAVDGAFRASGASYESLGDTLDACTLCLSTASRCTPTLAASAKFSAPGAPPVDPKDPLAVTDCLGRHPDGRRYAVCASIFGDAPRCVAMAMSSLFLDRTIFTFVNSYGESADVGNFGVGMIEEKFEPFGYTTNIAIGPNATLRAWQRMGAGGLATDALFVNSSGDCFTFDLGLPGRTPPENRADALDVPILNTPVALQFVHSFSLQNPQHPGTIGARWLDHGAYAYVGSVQEPFLSAFIPPREVMERLANGVPFLVAGRHYQGPFAVPWRIMTIGDPLMLATPPSKPLRKRLPPESGEPKSLVPPGTRAVADVRSRAKEALAQCKSDPSPSNFEHALIEIDRLGDDSVARNLWSIAVDKSSGSNAATARAALGALFRLRDVDAFLEAFRALPAPDAEALDMLWAMMTPRLSTLDSAEVADLLAKWPRPVRPQVDLLRLAPAMARLRGAAAARDMFMRAAAQSKDPSTQEALRQAAVGF